MIKNKTKKTIIASKQKIVTSIFSKTLGLMFSRKIHDFGLIFKFNKEQKVPLHMWFVFYPIDVLFLDRDKKIIEIKENFKPFTFYSPKEDALYIVELPNGSIKRSKTAVWDLIEF